ncbi:hypothetical protein LCGC14_1664380 [marine sediment metagenome]|uniref:DNA (cytosine-5-)-methyltransferase n=1 Tax=marine sediment metagenome TaxID=412755 RepID=A0A0F9K909_9ZZZZ
MRYGSVCSGIEATTRAWKPLGWEAAWFSEIERFPCAVLHHHYGCGNPVNKPNPMKRYDRRFRQTGPIANLGDITKITETQLNECGPIDLLVGGTPCQSFSVAGLRKGLADPRGNLALRFLQLARATRSPWVLWENVPGVHSSWTDRETFAPSEGSCQIIREAGLDPRDFEEVDQTADFDCFLTVLSKLGYGWAYRILDAQYVRVESHPRAVPQRRRRVFVVGYLGDWRRAAAVLFERESLCGYPPPTRETRAEVAHCLARGACGSHGRYDPSSEDFIINSLATSGGGGASASEAERLGACIAYRTSGNSGVMEQGDRTAALNCGTDPNQNIVAYQCHGTNVGEMGHLRAGNQGVTGGVPFVFQERGRDGGRQLEIQENVSYALLDGERGHERNLYDGMIVRRLTPLECERLQGFPDNYTNIPYGHPKFADQICPDGPRYKALGNSMAVPPMRWLGERIGLIGH